MDELHKCVSDLITTDDETKWYIKSKKLYRILTQAQPADNTFNEVIIPQFILLVKQQKLKKDLIYFSLLCNSDGRLLQELLNFEKTRISLNLNDVCIFFDYCYCKNSHWLLDVIENNDVVEGVEFQKDVSNVINILKLINPSNQLVIEPNKIRKHLEGTDSHKSNFICFYVKQLSRVLEILQTCQKYLSTEESNTISDIYYYASNNTILETFSKFLNLQDFEICDDVLQKLKDHKAVSEYETFTAFIILFNILYCLQKCKIVSNTNIEREDEISVIIKQTESKLLNLNNSSLQIELLENIFSILFLKNDHFLSNDKLKENEDFYCTENEVRLLLMFVNSICEEIKNRNLYDKTSKEFKRFTELNKYLADGLWRLELITNADHTTSSKQKIEKNIISYMLSPPESLIHLCLKQNDFNKAHQVIQIFNLFETSISSEVNYNVRLLDFKQLLNKTFKIRAFKSSLQGSAHNIKPLVETFFADDTSEHTVNISSETEDEFKFMNILDLTITQGDTFQDSEELFKLIPSRQDTESRYSKFYKSLETIFTEANYKQSLSARDILVNPEFSLDLESYKTKEELYSQLISLCNIFNDQITNLNPGKFNYKHVAHKTFLKLQELCLNHAKTENPSAEHTKYLVKLLNYLRSFAKILYVENNNTDIISKGNDASLFAILQTDTSEILETLIFKRKLDIADFEELFSNLKLDIVYHVTKIFFPKVYLHPFKHKIQNMHNSSISSANKSIIAYIQHRNWLLAYILNIMFKLQDLELDLNEIRVKTFINYLHLSRIQNLKALFNNNEVITAMQQHFSTESVSSYLEQQIIKPETDSAHQNILASQMSTGSFETGEEIFEGDLKITNWKHLCDVLDSIPQNQLTTNEELLHLRDMVLNEIVGDCFEPDFYRYVQFIYDDGYRRDCILNNMTTWPGEFCLDVLQSELSRFSKINEEYKLKFEDWYNKISLYEKIRVILQKNSWFEILLKCKNQPLDVLESLVNTVEIDILLNFIKMHEVDKRYLHVIDESYFVALLDSYIDLSKIENLMEKLPADQVLDICYDLLKTLKKLEHLDFVVEFISKTKHGGERLFKHIQMSLKMLSCCNTAEQEQMWCLINDPLSIIEVLIMNTKLDKLGQVLDKVKQDIINWEFDEDQISVEKLDTMLRVYAEKSLEFRVILEPGPKVVKTSDCSKLMQSLDSANFPYGRKSFIMPETVPSKTEWVQNYEVTECMCCMESTFSMFNRRHHCRRCGRVVCGACSLKRMQVPTYGDIQVRVCLDCYEQSHDSTTATSSRSEISTKSIGGDYWVLTNDLEHDQIVREEFSFEYAPSVSLCLAILKHHSKNEEYPKFLLDQCEYMLNMLQPTHMDAVQEIDYLLVVKMLKSLAIAAKMVSAQCTLHWGTSLADKILSQADLLGLLAEKGCLYLIPTCKQVPDQYIDAATLRRLRDKLVEREQWNLALEVSTKAGLDNTGVFAAWGKSFLKAGSLESARDKFQRCFDKTGHYETSLDLSLSVSGNFATAHFTQVKPRPFFPETRPTKNPPLLNEIIQILESNTCKINPKILDKIKSAKPLSLSTWSLNSTINISQPSDPAICILHKLKNLTNIAAGNYSSALECSGSVGSLNITKPHLDPLFYEECVYYLSKYGTHMSLLEFYIKHDDMYRCLKHMLDCRLNPDVFVEVYMLCLQENKITSLQENMSKIDSTLDVWKNYLKQICRHLEKHSQLHSLYQLQQFMGDFVRAAMTCIKFYQDEATSYSDLAARVDHLHKAQQHLQQELEQEQWVEVATVRKSSMDSQDSFEAKGIANPSLVMKIDSRYIDTYINTIWRQTEVAKFLADSEAAGIPVLQILPEILPFMDEVETKKIDRSTIPTLFGKFYDKVQLAVLTIICGQNVEDGFGLAFRIMQEHHLEPLKVYCNAGKLLAKQEKYTGIAQLVSCIRSSGISDAAVTEMCDQMLSLAVHTLTKANVTGPELDGLIKLITDRAVKISAYIESKQLKSAYLLAVKHKRMGDIRRILREAEFLNQPNIKSLCQRVLYAHSHSPSHSKD